MLTSIAWPYRGLRYGSTELECFFQVIRWQVATFQMIAGSSSIFLKYVCNNSCSWAKLLKFWFQTDLGRENSTGFYMQGRQSLLALLTIVTLWSRSTFNFQALIGQNLTVEFMRKIYAASGNLLTNSWSWLGFVSSCDVFNCTCPFLPDVPSDIEPLTRLFCVIHCWFVYLLFTSDVMKKVCLKGWFKPLTRFVASFTWVLLLK